MLTDRVCIAHIFRY